MGSSRAPGGWSNGERHNHDLQARARIMNNKTDHEQQILRLWLRYKAFEHMPAIARMSGQIHLDLLRLLCVLVDTQSSFIMSPARVL